MSDPVRGAARAGRVAGARPPGAAPLVAVLCSLLAGCQTFDEYIDAPAHVEAGPYAGVVAGGVVEQYDLPSGFDGETAWTAGLRGGWRFERHAAIELAYEEIFESDLDGPTGTIGEVSGRTIVVQGKGYLVDAPLQPYLLAGIGLIDAEVDDSLGAGLSEDDTATVYKLGGGLEAHSGEHLTFFIESAWTKPDGDLSDYEFVTILGGVNWRF